MKGIVIYKGKYGATRQYADWIATACQLPFFTPEDITPQELDKYELVIAGASVYAGRWMMRKWLVKNAALLKNKKLVLFIVCGTPSTDKESLDYMIRMNIPAHMRNTVPVYFLHGRLVVKQLSWGDRTALRLGAALTKDPVKKKEMLQDFDDVKKEHLQPLLQAIRDQEYSHMEG
jgi:Flavodoxin